MEYSTKYGNATKSSSLHFDKAIKEDTQNNNQNRSINLHADSNKLENKYCHP